MKFVCLSTLIVIACLFSGCATPTRSLSYVPDTKIGTNTVTLNERFQVDSIADERVNKELDTIFETNAIEEVERILQETLGAESTDYSAYTISGTLYALSWEVPNHKAMVRKAMTASLLTGGLGGIAYGSTSTPVFGNIDIEYRVSDSSGVSIFSKRYKVDHEEVRKKLNSDTPGAKSEVASKALSQSIQMLVEDLSSSLSEDTNPVATVAEDQTDYNSQ